MNVLRPIDFVILLSHHLCLSYYIPKTHIVDGNLLILWNIKLNNQINKIIFKFLLILYDYKYLVHNVILMYTFKLQNKFTSCKI